MEKVNRFMGIVAAMFFLFFSSSLAFEKEVMAEEKCECDPACGVGYYCSKWKDCEDEWTCQCRFNLKAFAKEETARADQAEKDRDSARAERDGFKKDLAIAQAALAKCQADLLEAGKLKGDVEALEKKVSRLKAKITKIKASYEAKLTIKDRELSELRDELREARGEIAELEASIVLLRRENEELKVELKKPNLEIFGEMGFIMNAKGQKKEIKVCGSECTLKWTTEYSAPIYGLLGIGYQFLLPKDIEVVGLRLGLFGKFGRGARFDMYGGAGLDFQIGIFPEPKRILGIVVDARVSYERAEDHEWAWNYGFGFGLGADLRTFGIYGVIRFERYGFPEEVNCAVFSVQFVGRVHGTRPK